MNWITKNIFGAIADGMSAVLDMYGAVIANIFDTIADANLNSDLITNASNFMTLFCLALLSVMAGKQILDVYVFQTSGDPDAEPLQLVVRVLEACAVICSNTWIFNEFLKFSRYFTMDLLISSHQDDVSAHMQGLLGESINAMETAYTQGQGMILTLLMMLIGFIIFAVVAGIRGAELTLMKVMCPLFAIDLITTNRERWRSFFTTYMITFFSYTIQLLAFKACSMTFISVTFEGSYAIQCITAMGWMVLMIRAPKWIEKFAYSSGVGNFVSSSVRMAPMMLTRLK